MNLSLSIYFFILSFSIFHLALDSPVLVVSLPWYTQPVESIIGVFHLRFPVRVVEEELSHGLARGPVVSMPWLDQGGTGITTERTYERNHLDLTRSRSGIRRDVLDSLGVSSVSVSVGSSLGRESGTETDRAVRRNVRERRPEKWEKRAKKRPGCRENPERPPSGGWG